MISNLNVTFDSPWFLVLLVLVPLVWQVGRKSLASIGRGRAIVAFQVRSFIVVLLVLALAETQLRQTSSGVSVVYLLDQSLSIPAAERAAMFEYVARAVATQRQVSRGDRAGVIVFGREAAVEVPPSQKDLSWLSRSESLIPRLSEATNLADAAKLALSILPSDSARRVVIIADGNENIGTVRQVIPQFTEQGIGIDVVPVRLTQLNDVVVDKIVLPATSTRGGTIEARVVITNNVATSADRSTDPVVGTLRVTRRAGNEPELLIEEQLELMPGKNVFPLVHRNDVPPGFYTYDARFIPQQGTGERTQRNNRATGFTKIGGQGRILFLESSDTPGEFDFLIQRLRAAEILVDQRTSALPFSSLTELQSYDTVVLANVARTSGPQAEVLFSEQQIEALLQNTEMGGGLVMLGGPHSFGAGGWANTRLEEVSPVDFTIKNSRVMPSGALVLVIDKSSSMQGEKITMSRQAAVEAMRVLGARDQIGVVAFDGVARWIVPMQEVGQRREQIVGQIRRLAADGGTEMFPGMRQGFAGLQSVDASVKHMIVLTDGRTQPGEFEQLTDTMQRANVTVSAVAVGSDSDRDLLGNIAERGGGKFYQVTSPQAIPRIFIKEAMRVAKPLIFERSEGFAPQVIFPHEILGGIDGPLPPMTGFVLTDLKENPLVEVAIRSPLPGDQQTATVLATWNYGLGRVVVFTSDAGHRWTSAWTQWENYDALFTQLMRWSMRPTGPEEDFLVATEVEDGQIRAIVTAMDEDRELLNLLDMSCSVTTPDLQSLEMPMKQIAPGRYLGELPVDTPGSYLLSIHPGRGRGRIRAGLSVPYAVEFKDQETNWPLLETLAAQNPVGGKPGTLIQGDLLRPEQSDLLRLDTFRPTLAKAISLRDIWPLLVMLAAGVFFFDVLNRRVALNPLAVIWPLIARLRRRPDAEPQDERIERLRDRKAAVERDIKDRRAAARWFPATDNEVAVIKDEGSEDPTHNEVPPVDSVNVSPAEEESLSYTARLLEAKRRAHEPRSKR